MQSKASHLFQNYSVTDPPPAKKREVATLQRTIVTITDELYRMINTGTWHERIISVVVEPIKSDRIRLWP